MTKQELRDRCGLKKGELVETNLGALDIFSVEDNKVTYGFLADGHVQTNSVEEFLKRMGK